MAQHYRVARATDVPPGTIKGGTAGLTPVLLANVEGTIYAIGGLCSHLYVPLSLGRLEGCVLTCMAHGSAFDVRSGEVVEWVGKRFFGAEQLLRLKGKKNVPSYPVRIEGEDVYVEL